MAVVPELFRAAKLPDGVGPDRPPQWRRVFRGRVWAWFDPRIRSQPGAVTPEMVRQAVPVPLHDFSIPLQVGDQQADIKGHVEFEPPRGRYVHRLVSPKQLAPGVEVGLLAGQTIPTVTLRNDSGQPGDGSGRRRRTVPPGRRLG